MKKMTHFLILIALFVPLLSFAQSHNDHAAMTGMLPDVKLDLEKVSLCDTRNPASWREAQVIEGVAIAADPSCEPDMPELVAASVKGTNNISTETLNATGLAPDAVIKENDLDGDGDPDEITIKLEIAGINEGTNPLLTYEIAPGIAPAFWAFVPKSTGMATENMSANHLVRMPSPVLRMEQGDKVKIVVENTHYLPHTLHLHGVDHPFVDENGEGNDGVPQTSEMPIMPGERREYNLSPRIAGSFAYHCHVQPDVHILMGLNGLLVVEENRPNNEVQTLNVGSGFVRHMSEANAADFTGEYDMHYQDIDKELHAFLQTTDDPAEIGKFTNRIYNITDRTANYYILNGLSFPYTLRQSQLMVEPDQKYRLRVFNIGANALDLHTHGHKMKVFAYDGVDLNPAAQYYRDVINVGAAQRLDVVLETTNDGLHSYGSGVWPFHDHNEQNITTDGIVPGGALSFITFSEYLNQDGMPNTLGVDLRPYFTPEFYEKSVPIWDTYDPLGKFRVVADHMKHGHGVDRTTVVVFMFWSALGLVISVIGFMWLVPKEKQKKTLFRLLILGSLVLIGLLLTAVVTHQSVFAQGMDMGGGEVSSEVSNTAMEGIDKIHIMSDGSVMLGTGVTLLDAYVTPEGEIVLGNGEVVTPVLDMRSDKTLGVKEPEAMSEPVAETPRVTESERAAAPESSAPMSADMSGDESFTEVSGLDNTPGLDGIHVMPNGRVMTGTGLWVDDASVTADGVIMLGTGEMIDPILDMRSGGGMRRTETSLVVNENFDTLPLGCSEISGDYEIVVTAGAENAEQFPGSMFTYDNHSFEDIPPCARVTVTFENKDYIRHQFMVHDLPPDTYPMGMFNIEVTGPGKETGTFIAPADPAALFVHCGVPEHEAKGMVAQIKIGESEDLEEVLPFLNIGNDGKMSLVLVVIGVFSGIILGGVAALLVTRRRSTVAL